MDKEWGILCCYYIFENLNRKIDVGIFLHAGYFNSFLLSGLYRGYYEDDTRLFKRNYAIIHPLIDAARYYKEVLSYSCRKVISLKDIYMQVEVCRSWHRKDKKHVK